MEIGPVTSATQITPVAPKAQELSSTDWKIYAKVVLSYMLIGIGLALACSSIYLAFAFNPMIAAASPITPIALGVLLNTGQPIEAKRPQLTQATPPDETPLKGIKNASGNCWINSSLQILFNVPAFRKVMENLTEKSELSELRAAFEIYKRGGDVDSQLLRKWLCKHDRSIDPSSGSHDDPFLFLQPIFKKSGYFVAKEIEKELRKEEGTQSVSVRSTDLSYFNFQFEADENGDHKETANVAEELARLFNSKHISQSGIEIKTIKDLDRTPEDFSIGIHRGKSNGDRLNIELQEAMELTLSGDYMRDGDASYYADGFIVHEGQTIYGGHYRAYLLRSGTWWEISDDTPARVIKPKEAKEKIAQASMIHYQKFKKS